MWNVVKNKLYRLRCYLKKHDWVYKGKSYSSVHKSPHILFYYECNNGKGY